MGRLKDFYFDEIVAQAERNALLSPSISPDTCYVLTERDKTTGETKPLHVYTFRSDAEESLRLFTLGLDTYKIPEYLEYMITEVVQS